MRQFYPKKTRILFLAGLTLLLLLSACSTSVPVTVVRAPTIELNGVKTLGVQKFSFSGHRDLDYVDSTVVDKIVEVFDKSEGFRYAFKKEFRDRHKFGLENSLQGQDKFSLAGNYKNAEAKIKGNINLQVQDVGRWVSKTQANQEVIEVYQLKRTALVRIDFQIKSKGKILGAGQISRTAVSQTENISKANAIANLQDWQMLSFKALEQTYEPFKRYVLPYTQTYRVKLEEGDDDDRLEEGAELAEDGRWDEAISLWDRVIASKKGEDQAAALFNRGVYHEQQGQYGKAINWYKKALKSYNLQSAKSGLQRVKEAQADRQKLNRSKKKKSSKKGTSKTGKKPEDSSVEIHQEDTSTEETQSQSLETTNESEEPSDIGVGF